MLKGGLVVFNILLVLILTYSLIMYLYNLDISLIESFIESIRTYYRNIIETKNEDYDEPLDINSNNTPVENDLIINDDLKDKDIYHYLILLLPLLKKDIDLIMFYLMNIHL